MTLFMFCLLSALVSGCIVGLHWHRTEIHELQCRLWALEKREGK
jgi:hypothetical protein